MSRRKGKGTGILGRVNKKSLLIGGMVAGIVVAGILGGILLFNIFQEEEWNVRIDGEWNEEESWIKAYNHHTSYCTPNTTKKHPRDYLHYYIHDTEDYIYILADITSDTTKEDKEDFIAFFFWMKDIEDLENGGYISEESIHNGFDYFCFNYTKDKGDHYNIQFSNFFGDPANETLPRTYKYKSKDFDDWDMEMREGFQKTINSDLKHRIYELKIKKSLFDVHIADRFYIGIFGYGTLASFGEDFYYSPGGLYFEAPPTYFECSKWGENHTSDQEHNYNDPETSPIFPEIPIGSGPLII